MTPQELIRRAVDLAVENASSSAGGPFAAIVAKDGNIVAEGTNLVTSANDPTAHAEIVAIRNACAALGVFELPGYEIYASCEPCPMCLSAIYWARIASIRYAATHEDAAKAGFDDSFISEQICLPVTERATPAIRLLPELAWQPFEAWQRNPQRTPY